MGAVIELVVVLGRFQGISISAWVEVGDHLSDGAIITPGFVTVSAIIRFEEQFPIVDHETMGIAIGIARVDVQDQLRLKLGSKYRDHSNKKQDDTNRKNKQWAFIVHVSSFSALLRWVDLTFLPLVL